jgi:hypothetical protein
VLEQLVKGILGKMKIAKEEGNNQKMHISPFQTLQRGFVISFCAYLKTESFQNLREIWKPENFSKFFERKVDITRFFAFHSQAVLRTIGFFREIFRKIWAKFGDEELQIFYNEYSTNSILLYHCDIVFLQISLNMLQNKNLKNFHLSFSHLPKFKKQFDSKFKYSPFFNKVEVELDKKLYNKCLLLYTDYWNLITTLVTDCNPLSQVLLRIESKDLKLESRQENFQQNFEYLEPIFHKIKQIVYCLGSCNSSPESTWTLNCLCFASQNKYWTLISVINFFDLQRKTKNL